MILCINLIKEKSKEIFNAISFFPISMNIMGTFKHLRSRCIYTCIFCIAIVYIYMIWNSQIGQNKLLPPKDKILFL